MTGFGRKQVEAVGRSRAGQCCLFIAGATWAASAPAAPLPAPLANPAACPLPPRSCCRLAHTWPGARASWSRRSCSGWCLPRSRAFLRCWRALQRRAPAEAAEQGLMRLTTCWGLGPWQGCSSSRRHRRRHRRSQLTDHTAPPLQSRGLTNYIAQQVDDLCLGWRTRQDRVRPKRRLMGVQSVREGSEQPHAVGSLTMVGPAK